MSDLNEGEQGYLSGQDPTDKWESETIELWISDREVVEPK